MKLDPAVTAELKNSIQPSVVDGQLQYVDDLSGQMKKVSEIVVVTLRDPNGVAYSFMAPFPIPTVNRLENRDGKLHFTASKDYATNINPEQMNELKTTGVASGALHGTIVGSGTIHFRKIVLASLSDYC